MFWLYAIPRTAFSQLFAVFTIAFMAYGFLVFRSGISLTTGIAAVILIRVGGFFFEPQLSDDYFRFVWDGWANDSGLHPAAYTPRYIADHPELAAAPMQVFQALNSPDYYSVYPPVAQWMFLAAYKINGLHIEGHILFYKLLLTVIDLVILLLLYRLLLQHQLPKTRILIYGLNPLVILEFTGNLHFDSVMIAAFLAAIYFSEKGKWILAGCFMSFSMLAKMLSLLLIPFAPREWYWKKMIVYTLLAFGLAGGITGLFFGSHTGWLDSVGLWFRQFEFNASLYYVARYTGFLITGYNAISTIGPVMAFIALCGMAWVWWKYKSGISMSSLSAMAGVLTLYFLTSTTVHPWYLGSVLTLSVLTLHSYPVTWTYLVYLSYSHYDQGANRENYIFILTEYLLLFGCMIMEFRRKE